MALFGNGSSNGTGLGKAVVGLYRAAVLGAIALLGYLASDKLASIDNGIAGLEIAVTEAKTAIAQVTQQMLDLRGENTNRDHRIDRLEDRLNGGPR